MSTGHGGSGASDLLWEGAGVCARVSVTGSSSLGNGLIRGRQGVSNQDKEGLFLGELKCLADGSLRPRQEIGKPNASGQGPFG